MLTRIQYFVCTILIGILFKFMAYLENLMRNFWLLFSLVIYINPALAGNTFADRKHSVALISAYETVGNLTTLTLGVHYKFKNDWKTYWRNPGVVGYPLKISTEGSQNVKGVQIHWPVPEEFTTYGLKSYGYGKETLLPLTVILEKSNKKTIVKLKLDYLVCNPANCIPQKTTLALTIEPQDSINRGEVQKSQHFDLIKSYLDQIPRPDTGQGITIERVAIDDSYSDHHELMVAAYNPNGFKSPQLFIEPNADIYVDVPEVKLSGDKKNAYFMTNIYLTEQKQQKPDISLLHKQITLTLKDGDQAVESPRYVKGVEKGILPILLIMFFAFLGGLILNVMPCVLPVVSIKILSIIQQGGAEKSLIRKNFLLTIFGILSLFWLIAILAIGLKSFGYAVGWGVQFQQPLFLVAMILIIALFAYNLLGYFEIMIPSKIATKLTKMEQRETPLEYFLSGAFVTLLATPCTAPFLGTALSFAFSRGPIEIASIFTIMGLGLAFPFILIAFFPGMVQLLPKPGRWTVTLKKSLSLLLFATLVWLLWVVSLQSGIFAALALASIVIVIGFVLRFKCFGVPFRPCLVAIVLLSGGAFLTPHFLGKEIVEKDLTGTVWEAYDAAKIKTYVAQGKVVFVDVTADWCLTCKANETLVLSSKDIQSLFKREDIVAMSADWTNGNEKVTAFLHRFGKYGVPFYVVYGPSLPDGKPLPELLTVGTVKQAIKAAAAHNSES